MDEKTLAALQGSIAKWSAIVNGTGTNRGPVNCPLCQVFLHEDMKKPPCVGCPVRHSTGKQYCVDTPYERYEDEEEAGDLSEAEMRPIAQAELDFLISLLPAEG